MTLPNAIAGDFLSLLSKHQATVFPKEVSGSYNETIQATTVFAFHFADGILMAGDRRATAGNVIVSDRIEKIIEIDSTSLLAIAGVPATAFEMARILQTSFEYYRRSQLQPLSLPARVRALARLLRENLPMTLQGIGIVVPLFAGLDFSIPTPQPRIYFYDPLGAQFQAVGHAASGSGSATIRSILNFHERHGSPKPSVMNTQEAVRFALQLLLSASEMDSATGGVNPGGNQFATLKILNARGIQTVSDAEQAEALLGNGLGTPPR
jgi:proteasome beta subunit